MGEPLFEPCDSSSRAQIPSADSESAEACKKNRASNASAIRAPRVAAPWGSNPYPSPVLSISRDWSRSGIKSCNPKNQYGICP